MASDKPFPSRKEMEECTQNLRASSEQLEMQMKEFSRLYHIRYESLISVGFTKEQALEIVKHRGISI